MGSKGKSGMLSDGGRGCGLWMFEVVLGGRKKEKWEVLSGRKCFFSNAKLKLREVSFCRSGLTRADPLEAGPCLAAILARFLFQDSESHFEILKSENLKTTSLTN